MKPRRTKRWARRTRRPDAGKPERPWSNAACMGYCLIAMRRANLRPGAQRRVLMVLEQCFDDVSVEDAEKAGYANTEG